MQSCHVPSVHCMDGAYQNHTAEGGYIQESTNQTGQFLVEGCKLEHCWSWTTASKWTELKHTPDFWFVCVWWEGSGESGESPAVCCAFYDLLSGISAVDSYVSDPLHHFLPYLMSTMATFTSLNPNPNPSKCALWEVVSKQKYK